MSTFTFTWPKGPEEVILTGTFDNWSKSLYLVKQSNGSFELTVPLPNDTDKVLYKYVVDGEWKVAQDQKIDTDDAGNQNNVLEASDLVSVKASGAAIPEAGGLTTVTKGASSEVKTTVMPQTEQTQSTLGEAGIHIPKDKESLAAFENVRDVDAKALNEQIEAEEASKTLTAAEKKKQKKKVKRSQYKAKKKKNKSANTEEAVIAGAAGAGIAAAVTSGTSDGVTATEESAEETPEPEEKAAVPSTEKEAAVAAPTEKDVEPVKEAEPESVLPVAEKEAEPVQEAEPVVPVAVEESAPVKETEPVEEPVAAAVEPVAPVEAVVDEPVAAKEVEPATEEPVATKEVEPVAEAPATEAPVAAPANETVVPVAADPNYHSLDPNSEGKEVEAQPLGTSAIPATKVNEDEEEIIVAQGKGDVEAQILAAENGDVTLEEIKPTESERAKLTEDAGLSTKSAKSDKTEEKVESSTPAAATTTPAATTAAKETKKEKKEEPKKKKGFFSKLKKIFS